MKDSKLVKILKTFSNEEIKSFEKFISSPYFNSVKIYPEYLKILMPFYPGFNDEKLSGEYIFKKLYKGKPYNKQVMWNLNSGFEKLAGEFLEQIALKRKSFQRMELLASELGNRNLLTGYMNSVNEMEKYVNSKGICYEYFENNLTVEYTKQLYYFLKNHEIPMTESKLKASEYQVLLFLRLAVGSLNDLNLSIYDYNHKFEISLLMEFIKRLDLIGISDYARSKKFKYYYLLDTYYHALMMLLEPEKDEHLHELRNLYMEHYSKFDFNEKRAIIRWMIMYCINRNDSAGINYHGLIFRLNKFRLKEKLVFYNNGMIHKEIFYQILSVALSAGEIKWAENFIEDYSPALQPELQESNKAMAYAQLFFTKKKYEKVLEKMNNVKLLDVWDKLYAKSLLAKTYYEMKNFESLLYHIDSTKHFLNSNKSVSEIYRKFYGNYYNYLIKLNYINNKQALHLIPGLKNQIRSERTLDSKKWLLEKADELETLKKQL